MRLRDEANFVVGMRIKGPKFMKAEMSSILADQ